METIQLIVFVSSFPLFVYSLPTGCTYDATEKLYTCDARSWSLPLQYTDFNTGVPQRLLLSNMAGNIASNTFSGFSSINTAAFDTRFVPSLHIMCYANSAILIDGTAFNDFSYIDEVKIIDCDILSLPAEVFKKFGDVNSFYIIGGSIDNMNYDAFSGLTVKRMTQYPVPLGELCIINSKFVDNNVANGAFHGGSEIRSIRIENANVTSPQTDMFYRQTKMTFLSLSNNAFTELNENLLSRPTSLATLELYGIQWECACQKLWFLHYAKENNITLKGDLRCATPASMANKRLSEFYQESCVDLGLCEGKDGFVSGGRCVTTLEVFTYVMTACAVIVTVAAFVLVVYTYRKIKTVRPTEEQRPGDEPVFGHNMGESTWDDVSDVDEVDSPDKPADDNNKYGTKENESKPKRKRKKKLKDKGKQVVNAQKFITAAQSLDF